MNQCSPRRKPLDGVRAALSVAAEQRASISPPMDRVKDEPIAEAEMNDADWDEVAEYYKKNPHGL